MFKAGLLDLHSDTPCLKTRRICAIPVGPLFRSISGGHDGKGQYFTTAGAVYVIQGGQKTAGANTWFIKKGLRMIPLGAPDLGWNGWSD